MEYEIVQLNTARNCLRYIINAFNIKEIYLPFYICPTLRNAVFKETCKIKYYNIDKTFMPKPEFPVDAYIVYPNYFGICSKNVKILSEKYPNLIVDNAHSFFSEPCGIASFNSVRKFFPKIRNGAFLYTTKTLKESYMKDNYSYETADLSYSELVKNETMLDGEDIKLMSDCTKNYLKNTNLEDTKRILIEKFQKYDKKYAGMNLLKFDLEKNDVPYKYPLLLEYEKEADKIASSLEKQGITIFRYWNNMPENFEEKIFYKNLITL